MRLDSLYPKTSAHPAPRLEWIGVGLIALAGLALRWMLWSTQRILSVDGTDYIRIARDLAGGPDHLSVQPYGYPVLIVVAHWVVPDWVTAARMVDLVGGLAAIPLTWLVARHLVGVSWLRLIPAAAVAALPLTVHYSLTTMSETPYLALVLAMFVFALRRRFVVAGVFGGCAFAVRPEGLVAVVALGALLFLARHRGSALRFAVGAAIVVGVYVVGQGMDRGAWTLTQKTVNIGATDLREREPQATGEAETPDVVDRLGDYGAASIRAYPKRFGEQTVKLLREGGYLVPVLAVAGLFSGAGLLAAGLAQALVTPLFALGVHDRFILPYLPFLWIAAVAFVASRRGRGFQVAGGALVVLLLAGSAYTERFFYTANEDGLYPELVETGEWLREHAGDETIIYDRKPYTAFYAGGKYRTLPVGTYDQILDAVVRDGGDYVVVNEQVTAFFRPTLMPLVNDRMAALTEPRLKAVYVNRRYLDGRTVVYRVVRDGGPGRLKSEAAAQREIKRFDHPDTHLFHGVLAMRAENWRRAAEEFNRALRDNEEDPILNNNRAWALLMLGEERWMLEAEVHARRAVGADRENPDYLDTLVRILKEIPGKERAVELWQGRLDEAIAKQDQTQ